MNFTRTQLGALLGGSNCPAGLALETIGPSERLGSLPPTQQEAQHGVPKSLEEQGTHPHQDQLLELVGQHQHHLVQLVGPNVQVHAHPHLHRAHQHLVQLPGHLPVDSAVFVLDHR